MGYVDYEVKGNYAVITINREQALNALNSEVLDDLDKVRFYRMMDAEMTLHQMRN